MTTEQKLRLLEISQSVTALNRTLFEMSAELETADLVMVVKICDKLLEGCNLINRAISN